MAAETDPLYAAPREQSPPASTPGPLPRGLAWALALTATFTMSVSYVDRQTLSALAPTVNAALNLDKTQYGLLLSAFSIAYLVGAPIAGRVIDAVGARRGMLGAVILWSAVAAAHALLPKSPVVTAGVSSFAMLFALRIGLGLAESPTFPGAAQTVQRALPPAERARGLGILYTGSSFGAMVAPPLASYLNERWDFRVAFLGTALAGLVWVPIWLAVAYNRRAAAVLDRRGEPGARKIPASELLRSKAVWRGVALTIACAPLLGFHIHWLSTLLKQQYGSTQLEIGKLLVWPNIIFDVGAVVFGSLATRAVKRRPMDDTPPRGLMVAATGIALLGVFLPMCPTPESATVLAGISMAGGGGMYALNTADVLRRVPPGGVSTAGGLLAAAQSLALIISSPIVGQSVELAGGYGPVLLGLAIWHLPGLAVWLFLPPPAVHRAESEAQVTPDPA